MTTDPSFRMTVSDVFSIRGRGTVVTGTIESGTLRVGDVFLKIDADQTRTDVEVQAMAMAPIPTPTIRSRGTRTMATGFGRPPGRGVTDAGKPAHLGGFDGRSSDAMAILRVRSVGIHSV